jgi:hypothetical protein
MGLNNVLQQIDQGLMTGEFNYLNLIPNEYTFKKEVDGNLFDVR